MAPDALVIRAPTDRAWLLLRIQSNGVDDTDAIANLQSRFVLRAVERPGAGASSVASAGRWFTPEIMDHLRAGTPPPQILTDLDPETFFGWAADLWGSPGLAVPAEDAAFVSRAADLGLRPGEPHDWSALSDRQRAALDGAMERSIAELLAEAAEQGGGSQDGWYYLKDNRYRVDGHGVGQQQPTNYTLRTGLAIEALGYLPLQEATYVSAGVPRVSGETLSGEGGRRFTLRFPRDGFRRSRRSGR